MNSGRERKFVKARGYKWLFGVSAVIAIFCFVAPYIDRWFPHLWQSLDKFCVGTYGHSLNNPFATGLFEYASIAVWVCVIVVALLTYGKPGLWLLTGLPFLLYDQFLILLMLSDWSGSINARIISCCGGLSARFFWDHLMLFYAGFWLSVDLVTAAVVNQQLRPA